MAKKQKTNNFSISNQTVIVTLLIAMAISIGGTLTVLIKLSNLPDARTPITGMADTQYGSASIEISQQVSIELDPNNNSIDFGTCNAPDNPYVVNISSDMTAQEINDTIIINCTDANTPSKIRILNTGNVETDINVVSDRNSQQLLTSASAEFKWFAKNSTLNGGCPTPGPSGGIDQGNFDGTGDDTADNVCDELGFGTNNAVDFFVNLTIPYDASTGGSEDTATLTFSGSADD
ncbi:MAG: hypothetical protein ACLFUO_05630 [Candidatus Woesearchaeota archaeon]